MAFVISGNKAQRVGGPITSLREAVTLLGREIEDLRWLNVEEDRPGAVGSFRERKAIIERAREFKRKSPLAKQACSLLINYTLGQGVTLRANNKQLVARLVDEFWEDPVNRQAFTSQTAMVEFLEGAFTDGDQFLVLFPDTETGTVQMGVLDPLMVEDIIADPENAKVPLWYKVRRPVGKYDFSTGQWEPDTSKTNNYVWYRDWRNLDDEEEELRGKDKDKAREKAARDKAQKASGSDIAPRAMGGGEDRMIGESDAPKRQQGRPSKIEPGLVYHAYRNRRGQFGESELAAALDWLKAHKDFMEDRATISKAAASIAWKKKRKGPASDVAAEVARVQSTLSNVARASYESNPPPATASTLIENEASTLEWVKTDTGGQAALADERILRMMVGSGMGGIPNHYFGDEANANLATATAMELPLLKMYEGWQKWLGDIVSDIVQYVLEVAHEAERLGDRDDEARYETTKPFTASAGAKTTPDAAPDPVAAAGDRMIGEAFGDPPGAEQELAAKPDEMAANAAAKVKVKEPPLTGVVLGPVVDDVDDPDAPVDWYVDVDFPPIIQKDVAAYMTALSGLYAMLPQANPESQKLVVSLALNAVGENDADQVMDKLFPGGAKLVEPQPPQLAQPAVGPDGKPLPAQPGQAAPGQAVAQAGGGLSGGNMIEAISPVRVRRVLEAVRDTRTALLSAGIDDDPVSALRN